MIRPRCEAALLYTLVKHGTATRQSACSKEDRRVSGFRQSRRECKVGGQLLEPASPPRKYESRSAPADGKAHDHMHTLCTPSPVEKTEEVPQVLASSTL